MKNWMRIIVAVFVLIGGTVFFGYWSLDQFDNAFDNLSASYIASGLSIPPPPSPLSGINNEQISTTSPETLTAIATSTDLELSFTFPKNGDEVYIGCTYPISWQSSTTISSLELIVVDAGTRETVGPITSGLAKENTIEKDSQNLKWKVGNVWPGEYYIKISKINGIEKENRSKIFLVKKIPNGLSTSKQEDICKKYDG